MKQNDPSATNDGRYFEDISEMRVLKVLDKCWKHRRNVSNSFSHPDADPSSQSLDFIPVRRALDCTLALHLFGSRIP